MTTQYKIFPCGCPEDRVSAGRCDVHNADGAMRAARARTPICRQNVMAWAREFDDRAKSANDLARTYSDDSHTHAEQAAIARTWQAAASMIRNLIHDQTQIQDALNESPKPNMIMLGVSFERVLADGTRERVDPSDLRITVADDPSKQAYSIRAAVDRG